MPNASWALQRAVHASLTSDVTLTTLLSGPKIYDYVPRNAAFPYVTFGQSTERDWSTGGDEGHEHVLTLRVWSDARGRKQIQAIVDAVRFALHDTALTLTGHRLINLRHEFTEVRRTGDGETLRGLIRFRAVTEPKT